jgi:nickel transport system substrate-binding protein
VEELNPHLYSPNQMFAQAVLYEPLVKYGEGNKVLPWLAVKWTISPDGKVYTFELRKDVKNRFAAEQNSAPLRKIG